MFFDVETRQLIHHFLIEKFSMPITGQIVNQDPLDGFLVLGKLMTCAEDMVSACNNK